MRFQVLGQLRVSAGQGWTLVNASQQRAVLALLLTGAGRTVSTDQLVGEIWGEHAPPAAARTMRGYVFRLRRLMGEHAQALVTRQHGYEIVLADGDLDVHLFERHAGRARHEAAQGRLLSAQTQWARALQLWRGPALADVLRCPTVAAEAARLDLTRLQAAQENLDILLRLGRNDEVAKLAGQLTAEHPLQESLWQQLMRALYRSGRRSEALLAYQQARRILVDELGLEPGEELRELQQTILAGTVEPAATLASQAVAAQAGRLPAQLPADVGGFTGRRTSLSHLDAVVAQAQLTPTAVVISTIGGLAGVGKTALALHWAHRELDRFPDGQLFADLRGYAAGPPRSAQQALTGFLVALGMPAHEIPIDLDLAAAHYRSLVAGRRMLILLDNAADSNQIRPLLPGSAGSVVLITSRDRLAGLIARDGATALLLDVLDPAEAHTLLRLLIGIQRPAEEPESVAQLAQLCGYLPLALRIAAAQLCTHPTKRISEYVAELLNGDRLAALSVQGDPHAAVKVAFDHSYLRLPTAAQSLFRTLGSLPGIDYTKRSAAAAAGITPVHAATLLEFLASAHMMEQREPGRYTFHDLIRLYAAQVVNLKEQAPAQERWHNYYLHTVRNAAERLYPVMLRLPDPQTDGSDAGEQFDGDIDASAWLDAESHNTVATIQHAAEHGPLHVAWQLADAMRGYFYLRTAPEWAACTGAGLAAARAAGDLRGQAAGHLSHALRHHVHGEQQQAIRHYVSAEDLSRRSSWQLGQATALGNLGNVHFGLGSLAESDACYREALMIARHANWLAGMASNLANLGLVEQRLGRPQDAADHLTEALALHRKMGSRMGEARNLANLADVYRELGRLDEALPIASEALNLHRELGDRNTEPNTLHILANIHRGACDLFEARRLAALSVSMAHENGDKDNEAEAQVALAAIELQDGQVGKAADLYRAALDLTRESGNHYVHTEAQIGLASTVRLINVDEAYKLATASLAVAQQAGYGLLEAQALRVVAAIQGGQAHPQYSDRSGAIPTPITAQQQLEAGVDATPKAAAASPAPQA